MKRSLLAAICCLVLGISSAHAQIHYGVKAGLNIASADFNASYESDFSSVTGFYAGPYAVMKLTGRLNIRPELLLSRQGYSYDHPQADEHPQFSNTYLNLPVMLQYPVTDQLHLEAGPQIGFLVSSRGKLGDESEETKDLFKSADAGLNIGLAYQLPAGFAAELRYAFGLSNIAEGLEDGIESVKNRVFSLGLAYAFK